MKLILLGSLLFLAACVGPGTVCSHNPDTPFVKCTVEPSWLYATLTGADITEDHATKAKRMP